MGISQINTSDNSELLHDVKKQSKKGFIFLTIRSVFIYLLQALSVLLLARWLTPKDYGIFAVINGWIGVSLYFSDVGTAGALISQASNPTDSQLRTCLAVNFLLSLIFTICFWLAAPLIVQYNKLDHNVIWMIRILSIAMPIISMRIIPKVLLDRGLLFIQSGKVDIVEFTLRYASQILLAGLKFGAWCFVIAHILGAITGTVLLLKKIGKFHLPWLSWKELQPLLKFGISFQANAIVPALRGLVVPLVLGALLPLDQVGITTWSIGLSVIPLILVYNYNQVVFPSLVKLKHSHESFCSVASRSTELGILGLVFICGLGATCSSTLIDILFNQRWAVAKPLMPIAILGTSLWMLSYLGGAVFNATGKPGVRLKIETVTVVIEFSLVWWIVKRIGPPGYLWLLTAANATGLLLTAFSLRNYFRKKTALRLVLSLTATLIGFTIVRTLGISNLFLQTLLFSTAFLAITYPLDRSVITDSTWVIRQFTPRKAAR
ncbi:MAG: oligosaccharide flippase family protein [Bdellovibrionota bacterium]|mgnify:CR=1 FL=1